MIVGILKEPAPDRRVVCLPETVAQFVALKADVLVESNAGQNAFASDADYQTAGAKVADANAVLSQADIVLRIAPFALDEISKMKDNAAAVAVLQPLFNKEVVNALVARGVTSFSLDTIPRTTRAQSMDILSSQATVSGYKAVLTAAVHLPTFFPMFMTAAGSIKPARVLILGAGVAGLQAIATAKRLGAVVEAFDTRSAVKEEVQSLGAKFVEVEGAKDVAAAGGYAVEQTEEYKQKQQQKIYEHSVKADVIISTAQIPGRKAPILIPAKTVEAMKPGSVIVDLAASTGGNCELTKNNETITTPNGVSIIGNSYLPSTLPSDASKMFGKNVLNLLKLMIDKEGKLHFNFDDDIVKGCCITHQGQVVNERVAEALTKTI
ncbi:MAG TPA: Re/Si-specific NAD(P)(+) transhydrogenase subunit alpha [Chitinophagales bacterium]|nr:Re/Si-specific NAD(P)(+) transhydrogenase subunit alpha [Chitinophagales bacterium]